MQKNFEESVLALQKKIKSTPISIEQIVHILSGNGRLLLLIFLTLPFCQPLQIPGLSTPFGLAISFIGFRLAFGKRIWLPRSILSKKIAPKTLFKITESALWLSSKLKRWVHPRWRWMCHAPSMRLVNGLMVLLLGFFLALPLPIPLSNLIAAWAIFFIAFGILESDGVLVGVGYLFALFTVLFLIVMFFTIKKAL